MPGLTTFYNLLSRSSCYISSASSFTFLIFFFSKSDFFYRVRLHSVVIRLRAEMGGTLAET